jgi:hypothetical protein
LIEHAPAEFVTAAAATYGFDAHGVLAVGYQLRLSIASSGLVLRSGIGVQGGVA